MEQRRRKSKPFEPLGWLALGAAIGYAAFHTLKSKKESAADLFDLDSVLHSCDSAAAKLDRLMRDETAQAS